MTFLWRPKQIQRRNSISDARLYPGVLRAEHFSFSPYKRRTVCLLRLVLVPLLPQSPSTPAAISNRTQLFLLLTDTFFSPFHPPLLVPFSWQEYFAFILVNKFHSKHCCLSCKEWDTSFSDCYRSQEDKNNADQNVIAQGRRTGTED